MNLLRRLVMIALGVSVPAAAQAVRLGFGAHPMGIVVGGASVNASPGNVTFTLTSGGTAPASSPITVYTQVAAIGVLDSLQIVAYFATSDALATASGDTIPASAVTGGVLTASSWRTVRTC